MSRTASLLQDLLALGATVEPAGTQLVLRAGHKPIPATLVRQVREAKNDLIAMLTASTGDECGAAASNSREARIIRWLDSHPAPSPPGACAWCREREGPGALVVPFGVQLGTHTWLHPECWPAWRESRLAEARRAVDATSASE